MAGLLGKKVGMTQYFDEKGEVVPVTVIQARPGRVLEVRPEEGKVKAGFEEVPPARRNRPQQGYFKKLDSPAFRYLREIRFADAASLQPGQALTVEMFAPGDWVDITGISKGKGFSGMIRRWGASRWPASHGHPAQRRTGSIGNAATPARVYRGKKMPGRAGYKKTTVQNLLVTGIKKEDNLILVRGAVPGPRGGLLLVRSALKRKPAPRRQEEQEADGKN
jgi:large subunit ribosomal protein L3